MASDPTDAPSTPSAAPRPTAPLPDAVPGVLRDPAFGVFHGFTERSGGCSEGAFASLNLGLSSGDEPSRVEANRAHLLQRLGVPSARVCAFDQVHGDRVLQGRPGWFREEADAVTSDDPDLLLVVSVADCLPLLWFDPEHGAVAAAHCGWRGTVKRLAGAVVEAMRERYGSDPAQLQVRIGPGIRGDCYQVGAEVTAAFEEAGFPAGVARADPSAPGRALLDLVAANRSALEAVGVPAANVRALGGCTHCQPQRFYSYRRDGGVTGRHWAFVRAPARENREHGGERVTTGARRRVQ